MKKANETAGYFNKMHEWYELDNYLHYKPITPFDFIWLFYNKFMTFTGLAD